jgi:hypothetical protein
MPMITISDSTYAKAKAAAEPFVDTEDSVLDRALDLLLAQKGLAPKGNGTANGRAAGGQGDEMRLPVGTRELTHTRLLTAVINGAALHRPDWNSLLREIHVMARKRLGSFDAVNKASGANLHQGRHDGSGYRYLAEVGLSIQGCDANHACEYAYNLAQEMRLSLAVRFEWREDEDAAHPGRIGIIEWSPKQA